MSTVETAPENQPAPEAPAKPTISVNTLDGGVAVTVEASSLETASFYKQDMPKANLAGVTLNGTKFYKANLEGASFEGANLTRCDFQVADLRNANMKKTNLMLANMINADLRGTDLTESNFEQARAWGAKWNKQTKFPKGFKPDAKGSRLIYQD
jgi:uncharacterized protein YjbI with pentapeptide repeats